MMINNMPTIEGDKFTDDIGVSVDEDFIDTMPRVDEHCTVEDVAKIQAVLGVM